MDWYVRPEVRRLELPDGQWVTVKKRLNYGEQHRTQAALIKEVRADGRVIPELEMVGKAEVMAYVLDWSATDGHGLAIPITTDDQKLAAINHLPPETFNIISAAVTKHIAEMAAEREARKNGQSTSTESSPTSLSAG